MTRDPGLQAERTALSWRRTLLSYTVAMLATLRFHPHEPGGWATAVGLVGASGPLVAVLLWGLARRRARAVPVGFTGTDDHRGGGSATARLPDGAATAVLAAAASAAAALAVVVTLTHP